MKQNAYNSLLELAARESARERTISYLTEHMRPFIEPGEYALICFPGNEKDGLRDLMADAVSRCGGYPLLTGEDHRWKTMLRLAFSNRASTIIGTPLTVLGLSKLKKASSVPLFIHNAITAGYPCTDWMKDGIRKGFDCRLWCTAGIFLTDIVAGFSCAHGTHLREEYLADAEDEQGRALPAGELGRLVLSLRAQPALRVRPGEFCRIEEARCPCGQPGPRLVDRRHWNSNDREPGGHCGAAACLDQHSGLFADPGPLRAGTGTGGFSGREAAQAALLRPPGGSALESGDRLPLPGSASGK